MGGIRLRQYRSGNQLTNGGCLSSSTKLSDGVKISDVPIVKERGCYADYSMDRQRVYVASLDSKSYGELGDEGFTFQTGTWLNSRSVVTGTSYYDRSSFSLELPPSRGRSQNIIWKLREKNGLIRVQELC